MTIIIIIIIIIVIIIIIMIIIIIIIMIIIIIIIIVVIIIISIIIISLSIDMIVTVRLAVAPRSASLNCPSWGQAYPLLPPGGVGLLYRPDIGAQTITNTIVGAPYYNYSTMGPIFLF